MSRTLTLQNLRIPLRMIFNLGGDRFRIWGDRLHECKFKQKGRFGYFPKLSTTYSSQSIHVSKDYFTWPASSQASNILHESVHTFQYDFHPWWKSFKLQYARDKEFRFQMELQAFKMNAYWWTFLRAIGFEVNNGRPNASAIAWVNRLIRNYPKNYLLPWQKNWFTRDRQEHMRKEMYKMIESAVKGEDINLL